MDTASWVAIYGDHGGGSWWHPVIAFAIVLSPFLLAGLWIAVTVLWDILTYNPMKW